MPEKLYIPSGTSPEGPPVSKLSSCRDDRSFLIDKLKDPADGRLIYPIDEDIMMPHLLRIFAEVSRRNEGYCVKENYDHSWYHRLHRDLRDPGGRAVRHTMGQVIPVWIHELKNARFGRLRPPIEEW